MTATPVPSLGVSKLNLLLVAALGAFRCHVRIQSPVTFRPETNLSPISRLSAVYRRISPCAIPARPT